MIKFSVPAINKTSVSNLQLNLTKKLFFYLKHFFNVYYFERNIGCELGREGERKT